MVHYERLVKRGFSFSWNHDDLRRSREQIQVLYEFVEWAEQHLKIKLCPEAEQTSSLFVIARYLAEGERVFRIEPGLARLLLDTQLPKLVGRQLQLPFPALFLEFPGRLFDFPMLDAHLIGCYLMDLRPKASVIGVDCVFEPKWARLGMAEFCFHVNIFVPPAELINWGDLYEDFAASVNSINDDNRSLVTQGVQLASELLPFVINAILYATSASPEITEQVIDWRSKKIPKSLTRKRQKIPTRQLPLTHKYHLGSSIPISYGAPRATDQTQPARSDRRILKRFRVRGHWRWQAFGSKRLDRKHIFIAPYWKGPQDLAELLKRKYQLA